MKKSTKQVKTLTEPQMLDIPLSLLFLSKQNIRKSTPTGIEELAELIASQGLLSPLQVTAEVKQGKETGRYGVVAGGRRLRALNLLAKNGRINTDQFINCAVIVEDRAVEVSLAENIGQEPMHPADEFTAYQTMITQGATAEGVAAKFGVTVPHVLRRLKLANVAPELFKLFKDGEMSLDQMMALASTDDHERQQQAWHGTPSYNRNAYGLKVALTLNELPVDDKRVEYVHLDAYVKAGGRIREDLFAEEGKNRYVTDLPLLCQLLESRMNLEKDALLKDGWAWVECLVDFGYDARQKYCFVRPEYAEESAKEKSKREKLEKEIDKLTNEQEKASDQDDDEAYQNLEARIDGINEQIEQMQEARSIVDSAYKCDKGVILYLTEQNGLEKMVGMVSVETVRKTNKEAAPKGSETGQEVKDALPASLAQNLSSHRSMAMQAELIAQPKVALALLATKMSYYAMTSHGYATSPVKASFNPTGHLLRKNAASIEGSKAAELIEAELQVWQERLPKDESEWFPWFLKQSKDVVLSAIVFATSVCTETVQQTTISHESTDQLEAALNLDMANWWTVTPETYLNLIPKARIMDMVSEVVGEGEAADLEKLKKKECIDHAMTKITGSRWLPPMLRSKVTEVAVA